MNRVRSRLRPSWGRVRLVILAMLLGVLGAFVTPPSRALAAEAGPAPSGDDSTVVAPPRDVPLVLQPQAVTVPKVPSNYQQTDMGWLRLSYVPVAHERVEPLVRDADSVKAELADALGQPVLAHVEVRVARTFEEMAALAPQEIGVPAYASGVAYPGLHLILLTLTAPHTNEAVDLGEVFRHELAHVALEDAVLDHHVPRWFNEGLALYLSGENRFTRTHTLWNATLSNKILPLAELDRGFPDDNYEVSIAYAESGDFVRFLLRDPDRERFGSLIDRTRKGEPFDRALADAYATDLRKLQFQWLDELSKRYTYLPMITGGSLLWVLVIGALGYGYVKKRRRAKAILARWAREEAAADELAALRAARLLPEPAVADEMHPASMRPIAVPKVEHDGNWHTLH